MTERALSGLWTGRFDYDRAGVAPPVSFEVVITETGRVFTANGPWVVAEDRSLRACMMNMLAHRVPEAQYYRDLLAAIADAGGYELSIVDNPHRWEGMADVAVANVPNPLQSIGKGDQTMKIMTQSPAIAVATGSLTAP